MTHIPKDPLILLSCRRLLGRLALGGSAHLAVAGTAQEPSPERQAHSLA